MSGLPSLRILPAGQHKSTKAGARRLPASHEAAAGVQTGEHVLADFWRELGKEGDDPSNAMWQEDVGMSRRLVADLQGRMGGMS